jgi:hypothetical protein
MPEDKPSPDDAPWSKALSRAIASSGTWFVTEYPKLLFQQQQRHPTPLISSLQIYRQTPWNNHVRGVLASFAQRGTSAFIMFYGQATISKAIHQHDGHGSHVPEWRSAGMAGFLGGGISALVHTLFEPIKIRHAVLTRPVYLASLWPMMWRHALFDGTFFATNACLYDRSYATQFGVSALAASTVNLTHDVWKTQFIQALPSRLRWMTVIQGLTLKSFQQQLVIKAADLGFNWWVTGLLFSYLFH